MRGYWVEHGSRDAALYPPPLDIVGVGVGGIGVLVGVGGVGGSGVAVAQGDPNHEERQEDDQQRTRERKQRDSPAGMGHAIGRRWLWERAGVLQLRAAGG